MVRRRASIAGTSASASSARSRSPHRGSPSSPRGVAPRRAGSGPGRKPAQMGVSALSRWMRREDSTGPFAGPKTALACPPRLARTTERLSVGSTDQRLSMPLLDYPRRRSLVRRQRPRYRRRVGATSPILLSLPVPVSLALRPKLHRQCARLALSFRFQRTLHLPTTLCGLARTHGPSPAPGRQWQAADRWGSPMRQAHALGPPSRPGQRPVISTPTKKLPSSQQLVEARTGSPQVVGCGSMSWT